MKRSNNARRRKIIFINTFFVLFCLALVLVLYFAPEETTAHLPHDEIHAEFHKIKSKKEADGKCVSCHSSDGEVPLPPDHPSPFRCLFCHKRDG